MTKKQNIPAFCFILLIICLVIVAFYLRIKSSAGNTIKNKIIYTIDSKCAGEGECSIDLGSIFNNFDWDTVSIIQAGNPGVIRHDLGIDNDISDGILFSLNGHPLVYDLTTYAFPEDEPPDITYSIIQPHPQQTYYITLSRDNSVVYAKKYYYNNGKTGCFKYEVYIDVG